MFVWGFDQYFHILWQTCHVDAYSLDNFQKILINFFILELTIKIVSEYSKFNLHIN